MAHEVKLVVVLAELELPPLKIRITYFLCLAFPKGMLTLPLLLYMWVSPHRINRGMVRR